MRELTLLLALLLCTNCKKKVAWDTSRSCVIEGYLYSSTTKTPVIDKGIAITQKEGVYSSNDPFSYSDSNGYFKVLYTPNNSKGWLILYPKMTDNSCIYYDVALLKNIEKGKDVNVGKIYTSAYD